MCVLQAQLAVGATGIQVLMTVLQEDRDDLGLIRGTLECLVAAMVQHDVAAAQQQQQQQGTVLAILRQLRQQVRKRKQVPSTRSCLRESRRTCSYC